MSDRSTTSRRRTASSGKPPAGRTRVVTCESAPRDKRPRTPATPVSNAAADRPAGDGQAPHRRLGRGPQCQLPPAGRSGRRLGLRSRRPARTRSGPPCAPEQAGRGSRTRPGQGTCERRGQSHTYWKLTLVRGAGDHGAPPPTHWQSPPPTHGRLIQPNHTRGGMKTAGGGEGRRGKQTRNCV